MALRNHHRQVVKQQQQQQQQQLWGQNDTIQVFVIWPFASVFMIHNCGIPKTPIGTVQRNHHRIQTRTCKPSLNS
eukprot:scaffold37822_cov55-Attheya_sp.AAC.4